MSQRAFVPIDPTSYAAAVLHRARYTVDDWCAKTGRSRIDLAQLAWPDLSRQAARSRYNRAMQPPVDVEALARLANAMGVRVASFFSDGQEPRE